MKKILAAFTVLALLFSGCGKENTGFSRILSIRQQLMQAQGCRFDAIIEADYGDKIYSFSMSCHTDEDGVLLFEVTAPERICGISGSFGAAGGKLIFHETALAFPTLADGEITPVSAPWLFMQTILHGYIDTVGMEQELLRATIYDNYEDNALQLDIWFDSDDRPVLCEILWQGRRVLTVKVENFEIL